MVNSITRAASPLIPLRATGDKPPLFCLPGAGGEAHTFVDLASLLGEDQPVFALNMRDFYKSRPNFTIREIGAHYLESIRTIQREGPYNFCGYSFGAFVAYEMAAILAELGQVTNLLGLIDAANPAMTADFSVAEQVQFRSIYLKDRLSKYARNLVNGNFSALSADAFAFLGPRIGMRPWLAIRKAFSLLNVPLPVVLEANDPIVLAACKSYRPSRYGHRVVLFRSAKRGPEFDTAAYMGWDRCTTGAIEVHRVPGDHVAMMVLPQVKDMAAAITAYLDGVEPSGKHLAPHQQPAVRE